MLLLRWAKTVLVLKMQEMDTKKWLQFVINLKRCMEKRVYIVEVTSLEYDIEKYFETEE